MKFKFNSTEISKKILKRADKAKSSRTMLKEVARIWEKNVKADTVKGKSYTGQKFPPLSDAWIDRRADLADSNITSEFYKETLSNASFMGDTLNGITANPINKGVKLTASGRHRIIIGTRGKPLKGSNALIADIVRGLKSMGRWIMGVSKRTKKQAAKAFKDEFRRTK